MQIIFEQDPNNRHTWIIRLMGTWQVVGHIYETRRDELYTFATYGNHPSGNRYQSIWDTNLDDMQKRAVRWANRRFK